MNRRVLLRIRDRELVTVSELFPVELRGMAIAIFYAFGTLVGAIVRGECRGSLAGIAIGARLKL